jgi:hypothetical protein
MNLVEQFILARCAELVERWGIENGVVDISPWAPPDVQTAWRILIENMGEEIETAASLWASAFSPPGSRGAPS